MLTRLPVLSALRSGVAIGLISSHPGGCRYLLVAGQVWGWDCAFLLTQLLQLVVHPLPAVGHHQRLEESSEHPRNSSLLASISEIIMNL